MDDDSPTAVSPAARAIREALADAGLSHEPLEAALGAAGLSEVPRQPNALRHFLVQDLYDALLGRIHPATASRLVESLVERCVARSRPPPAGTPDEAALDAPTVPPPAAGEGLQAYEELASGLIHDRETPVWGVDRSTGAPIVPSLWVLVSAEPSLTELAERAAPAGTDVVVASSAAVLGGALSRSDDPASGIVIDAQAPSVPLDRTLAALVEGATSARILVWRMPTEERERWLQAVPMSRGWLWCEAEVTPSEIVQLLGA